MPKKMIGVDLGVCEVKFALVSGNAVQKTLHVHTPENLISNGLPASPQSMASFFRDVSAQFGLRGNPCALALSPAQSFTRCVTVPRMTLDQLALNLPYEFRDYITQEKEKYHYDYAVLDDRPDDNGGETDLMACAALKSTLVDLEAAFHQARLRLKRIVPEEFAYRNLIRNALPKVGDDPVCLIDLGHSSTRIHIFKGQRFEVTRIIDVGGAYQDSAIGEFLGEDPFLSRAKKLSNHDDILTAEPSVEMYRSVSLDVMRAVNFYNYDSQTSLEQIYVMGGGAMNPFLVRELESSLGVNVKNAADLLPKDHDVDNDDLCLFATAVGAAWQREG